MPASQILRRRRLLAQLLLPLVPGFCSGASTSGPTAAADAGTDTHASDAGPWLGTKPWTRISSISWHICSLDWKAAWYICNYFAGVNLLEQCTYLSSFFLDGFKYGCRFALRIWQKTWNLCTLEPWKLFFFNLWLLVPTESMRKPFTTSSVKLSPKTSKKHGDLLYLQHHGVILPFQRVNSPNQPPEAASEAPTLAGPDFAPWHSSLDSSFLTVIPAKSVISLQVSSTCTKSTLLCKFVEIVLRIGPDLKCVLILSVSSPPRLRIKVVHPLPCHQGPWGHQGQGQQGH